MRIRADELNERIDRLVLGKSPFTAVPEPDEGDLALLRLASLLDSARPGAALPDPRFRSRLRARMLLQLSEWSIADVLC